MIQRVDRDMETLGIGIIPNLAEERGNRYVTGGNTHEEATSCDDDDRKKDDNNSGGNGLFAHEG
jgi:hypothetical protein